MSEKDNKPDLGDDLIEATASFSNSIAQPQKITSKEFGPSQGIKKITDPHDSLKSAEILFSENLIEDAKKELHQLIIQFPDFLPAKKKLKELHELELKNIFSHKSQTQRRHQNLIFTQVPSDSVNALEKLDRDLNLNLMNLNLEKDFFKSEGNLKKFTNKLIKEQADSSLQNFIDLGIGFYEMEFYEVALTLFQWVKRKTQLGSELKIKISSRYLECISLISLGRYFDASLEANSGINDLEMDEDEKTHFMYLLGVTHEKLGKIESALAIAERIYTINPFYRDIGQKIETLKRDLNLGKK